MPMFSSSSQSNITVGSLRSFPGVSDIWFSLNGTIYKNNSFVILENIGEGDAALLCLINETDCCRPPHNRGGVRGNWSFPNGTRVPSSGKQWDIHRTRGHMVVTLNMRRGGGEGVYRCEIRNAMNVTQTIYIGVYTASTRECDMYIHCHTELLCRHSFCNIWAET